MTMLRLLPEFMQGTHPGFPQVRMGQGKSLSIQADRPLYIHADGEIYTSFGSNLKSLQIELISNGLQVIKGMS